jgi:hypothetical protein
VHTLKSDRSGLQVAAHQTPQARLDGDSIDLEQRGLDTGLAQHNRPHHESKRSIKADLPLEASAWESGGEFRDSAFAERASDRCREKQRKGAKVKDGS